MLSTCILHLKGQRQRLLLIQFQMSSQKLHLDEDEATKQLKSGVVNGKATADRPNLAVVEHLVVVVVFQGDLLDAWRAACTGG